MKKPVRYYNQFKEFTAHTYTHIWANKNAEINLLNTCKNDQDPLISVSYNLFLAHTIYISVDRNHLHYYKFSAIYRAVK